MMLKEDKKQPQDQGESRFREGAGEILGGPAAQSRAQIEEELRQSYLELKKTTREDASDFMKKGLTRKTLEEERPLDELGEDEYAKKEDRLRMRIVELESKLNRFNGGEV